MRAHGKLDPAFRGDVEGLRAVAIAVVLLTHAGVPGAGGGYVGVDVFFVISGFLITRLLVTEVERTGRVRLGHFYARRIKRLLPQAVTVIVAVAAIAPLVLGPVRAEQVARDVTAAGAYSMNLLLSGQATDYFASGDSDGPLDHFWSLAVEEQFYVLWPPLLLAITWPWRRTGGTGVRPLGLALALAGVASLAHAVQAVETAPAEAYFSTPARAWELALGGVVSIALGPRRLHRRQAAVAAWSGLAAILAATVLYGPGTPFPGPAALLPTLGAAALLVAGSSLEAPAPTRLLMRAPVRYVGRISYAWYVWHWPAVVFAGALLGPLPPVTGVLVTAASVVPAIITHHVIEEPLRRSTIHLRRPRATLAAAPLSAAAAAVAGLLLAISLPATPTLAEHEADGARRLTDSRTIQRSARALRPAPRDADGDRSRAYTDGCLGDERATRSARCAYGDVRSTTTVVLFGDSHAMQYFPPLERLARRRGWRLVHLAKAACPPSRVRVYSSVLDRAYPECDRWREHALRRIERDERPAMVIATGSARYKVMGEDGPLDARRSTAALAAGYRPTLDRLVRTGAAVVVLRDTPRPPMDVPDCVASAMDDLRRCAFPKRGAVDDPDVISDAARSVRGVRVIDPIGRFCVGRLCPAVIGDVLVYRNSGHVTATYTATMTPWLARRLPRLSPR